MYGPPGGRRQQVEKMHDMLREPKPKKLSEVPSYCRRVVSKFFSRLFYIFRLVWETKPWILFLMLFMAIFDGVSPLITAFIGADVLNALADAFNGKVGYDTVLWLIVLQFSFSFLLSIISNINSMITRIASEQVTNHIKVKIMNKAKEIDLSSYDMPEFYAKLENANNESGMRPMQILSSTLSIASTIISMVSFIAVLAAISSVAPLLIILVSIPSAIINFLYRSKNVKYMREHSKDRRQMRYYSDLVTNKDMVKELRIFNLSDHFIGRYNDAFDHYFRGLRHLIVRENLWHIVLTVIRSVVNCVFFLYIAKMVCEGQFQVGSFSLYTGALVSISNGVNGLINTTSQIYEGTLFIDNMIAFMNHRRTVVPLLSEPRHVSRGGHTIVFDDVSFRYPGSDHDVLHHISFTLDPGDTAVLVGLNGAGKTTLIKLLTRLYDPTEGRVLLDGHDIREYNTDELYNIFGIIFQDFGKYAVSVRDNIHFGQLDKELHEDEIVSAAEQSDSDAFINALPSQYDTPLMRYFEDNGIELSIGQWQKLSIARAFYSDSDVIILDEPTASLDALAEQEIYNQFDSLRRDKTTVFVSHRLSSATVANKIIVLQKGTIVEMGDHTALMRLRGHYYTLFSTQASRYISQNEQDRYSVYGAESEQTPPPPPIPPVPGSRRAESSPHDYPLPDHVPRPGMHHAGDGSKEVNGSEHNIPKFGGKGNFEQIPDYGVPHSETGKPPFDGKNKK